MQLLMHPLPLLRSLLPGPLQPVRTFLLLQLQLQRQQRRMIMQRLEYRIFAFEDLDEPEVWPVAERAPDEEVADRVRG